MAHNHKGRIRNYELYAQGKMLDHSGWAGKLTRGRTPSDIDMVFDFAGTFLFIELKLNSPFFHDMSKGQRILYKNLVKLGHGKVIAVCAHIHTLPEQEVATLDDVIAFQVMTHFGISEVRHGSQWLKFVQDVERLSETC